MKSAQLTLPDGSQLDYHIRLSKRAKYMRLTFSADKGLTVTQPTGVSAREIGEWVNSKLDWISRHVNKMTARKQAAGADQPLTRPEQLEIPLLKRTLQIHYQQNSSPQIASEYDEANGTLTLSGATDNTGFCIYALQKWTQGYARLPLGQLLAKMANETGLTYNSYRIKAQRTRWGSCSSRGNINLNYKLLLMPEPWARYTVVHELCHTVEMNHSKRFWALVGNFVPDYKTIHAEMKHATLTLPAWANVQQPA